MKPFNKLKAHSPNKFMRLDYLKEIEQNNGIGRTGKEFDINEVKILIAKKVQHKNEMENKKMLLEHELKGVPF